MRAMMKKEPILLLARTQINPCKDCLGGINLNSNKSVRLMIHETHSNIDRMPYKIGEIWEMDYINSETLIAPHSEDIIVINHRQVNESLNKVDLSNLLYGLNGVSIWEGNIQIVFNRKLNWTAGGIGFLNKENIPGGSVGFWKIDKPLFHTRKGSDWYYYIDDNGSRKFLKYAGKEPILNVIPKNTLVRVSLTRWLTSRRPSVEARCYLQLSGWYSTNEK